MVTVFSVRDKHDPKFSSTGSQEARETTGLRVPERQAKTHLQKGPFQNKDRRKGKPAAIRRVLSGTSVGTPGLDQRPWWPLLNSCRLSKQDNIQICCFYPVFSFSSHCREGATGDEAAKVSENVPLLSIDLRIILVSVLHTRSITLSWATVVSPPLSHTRTCPPRLNVTSYAGVWGSAIMNTFFPVTGGRQMQIKVTMQACFIYCALLYCVS